MMVPEGKKQSQRFHENIVYFPTVMCQAMSTWSELMPTGVKNKSLTGYQKTLFFVELHDGTLYTTRPTLFEFGMVRRNGVALRDVVPDSKVEDIAFFWKIKATWDDNLVLLNVEVLGTYRADKKAGDSKQSQLVSLFEKGNN